MEECRETAGEGEGQIAGLGRAWLRWEVLSKAWLAGVVSGQLESCLANWLDRGGTVDKDPGWD